jgi:uncharacterized protein
MMTIDNLYLLFLFLLPIIAFLYASVGHGGASGYLALLALFSIQPATMKSTVLLLNIAVSLIAFYNYYQAGYFKWSLFFPFAITSIPASFIGATLIIEDTYYKKILGVCLLFPIARLIGLIGKETATSKNCSLSIALLIGGFIGLVSGMIGIGGGILLSPIILLLHWGNLKQTAAVSALFIFVNSITGFFGLLIKGVSVNPEIYLWLLLALAGGMAGAYFGSYKFNNPILKYILALVLSFASIKLLLV